MSNWFECAFDEYERPLVRFVHSLVADLETARDIVQEAFVKLHRHGNPSPDKSPGPWLFTVCRNAAYDHLRRSSKMVCLENLPEPAADEPEEQTTDPAETEWLLQAVEALPVNQREVVRLRFNHGLKYKEIAQFTGLSPTNVGFLLSTALHRLRDLRRRHQQSIAQNQASLKEARPS